jgi:hypothetical protein
MARFAIVACLGSALVAACSADSPAQPAPPAPGVVLSIDGVQVTAAEVDALTARFDAFDSRVGRATRIRYALDSWLLPLKLAERAFAAERAVQLERAEALARAVDNGGYPALRAQGAAHGRELRETRRAFPLPVADWLFAIENVGRVSPVIATPQGFTLVSAYQIERGTTRMHDRVEAFQAVFYTHDARQFDAWVNEQRGRIADRIGYVHPDYREALPAWLKP